MNGWRLESPDQEEVVSVLNTASNTVVADIQELSPTVQTLHWVAPSSYVGNRVRQKKCDDDSSAEVCLYPGCLLRNRPLVIKGRMLLGHLK